MIGISGVFLCGFSTFAQMQRFFLKAAPRVHLLAAARAPARFIYVRVEKSVSSALEKLQAKCDAEGLERRLGRRQARLCSLAGPVS